MWGHANALDYVLVLKRQGREYLLFHPRIPIHQPIRLPGSPAMSHGLLCFLVPLSYFFQVSFQALFYVFHFPMQIMNVVDYQTVKYWRAICEPLSFWMKRMLIISYLRFSYFHLVSLDFIHFVCHISLQTPIFRGWRFNIFNLCKHSKSAFSC